jgi:hypothetical protein
MNSVGESTHVSGCEERDSQRQANGKSREQADKVT